MSKENQSSKGTGMTDLKTLQDFWQKPMLTRGTPSLAEISLVAITMVYGYIICTVCLHFPHGYIFATQTRNFHS